MKILITEAQLNRLCEMGGRQLDLFMNTDEQDTYNKNYDKRLYEILREVEKACEWTHDQDKVVETELGTMYKCYPVQHFARKTPVPRHEFVRMLSDRLTEKHVTTGYPRTIMRPEDWYVSVTLKHMR